MIYYTISSKTKHWSRRIKKIEQTINQVLVYKKGLKFVNDINYYCNFVLANDSFIKNLNSKFNSTNKSTDVLTFVSKYKIKNMKQEKHCDIIFSIETILKDAKKNKTDFYNHLAHLIVHSLLHINNFMHIKIRDYLIMQNIEINVLRKLGISNPYYSSYEK